ncbi:MAG: hypothetical protein R2681_12520 [Pyrinomonadaceae bacterium]
MKRTNRIVRTAMKMVTAMTVGATACPRPTASENASEEFAR